MYATGRGVLQDDVQAADWFRKAAEQGNAYAQSNLALMYASGRGGLPQDDKQAVEWYRKAAEQGNTNGQTGLGFMYEQGRGVVEDHVEAVKWYRKAAEQGYAIAQTNLGVMYRAGRGVPKDQAEAERWFRKAAEQGDARAQTLLSSLEQQQRDLADLSQTIADLVKAKEPVVKETKALDPERVALAHEIIEVSLAHEKWADVHERFAEGLDEPKPGSRLPPKLAAAIRATAVASFQPAPILASLERKLADSLDVATLRAGLQWERSDVGRKINRLQLEAEKPERRLAAKEFMREFTRKGGVTDDPRARACAQVDILSNGTDALLPIMEAFAAAGIMAVGTQQGQPLDMNQIERAVVAVRPLLREATRQIALATCLFELRDLTDGEFEQWLEFLRSDAGGRYERAATASARDALLARVEIFTRVLLDVTRQLKGRGES